MSSSCRCTTWSRDEKPGVAARVGQFSGDASVTTNASSSAGVAAT
jgi:hypothetical protein